MDSRIGSIANELRAGQTPPEVSVRTFLGWFDAQRRRYRIVQNIRDELAKEGVRTVPDFETVWIDAPIRFVLSEGNGVSANFEPKTPGENPPKAPETVAPNRWESREATYKVGRLAAANQGIVSVPPDKPVAQAVTIMMLRGFSQLPVMTDDGAVLGMLSWRSVGTRMVLNRAAPLVRDAMEPHHEVRSDVSIFDAIQAIVANDYVLVRGADARITGIVTANDLSLQFHDLTEPFLLLGEIENLVRNLIGNVFSADELKTACNPADASRVAYVETVADLSFGEYIRLLQLPPNWSRLAINIERDVFCQSLDAVRKIRNDVMHFDPDGIEPEELQQLRQFTRFMRQLASARG
ncbi:CBS domain-containing protein [Rhodomicrobium sp.]|uniref:CBS domain-containing protein n=1 Tax=Rhodomicrobium sp. TaxID=2720632 RepID=UPI0039E46169